MTQMADDMTPLAEAATRLLKTLAHPARLLICCRLRDGEMSVSELEGALGVRQPRLSRELSKLREDGIVATRREAKAVFYRLEDPRAVSMIDAICAVMKGDAPPPLTMREHGVIGQISSRAAYGVFAQTANTTTRPET